ncbi:MAG TPA: transaldolase family protein [Ktedonobacteraceae bacterium]|nr:transaldolase family protein [Ktedonobacteraceae bacterium]
MALYVDSAYLNDITNVAQTVPLAGVTTNPSILLAARERGQTLKPKEVLLALLQHPNIDNVDIFVQPGATDEEEMYQQVIGWVDPRSAYARRLVHKIPMNHAGMRVARRLIASEMRIRIAFTAVTTVVQAYTAAIMGVEYVIPYYNRLERSGIDANERIAEMAEVMHNHKLPTRILVASIKTASDARCALLAGAHDITAAPQVILDMVSDPLTDEAIEKFSQDWNKMNKL